MSRLYTALDPVHGIFTPDSLLLVPVFLSYIVIRIWRYVDLLVYNIWLFFVSFYILKLVFLTLKRLDFKLSSILNLIHEINIYCKNGLYINLSVHQFMLAGNAPDHVSKRLFSPCQLEFLFQPMFAQNNSAHVSQDCLSQPMLA